MIKVEHIKNTNSIKLYNNNTEAIVDLENGASLSSLKLKGKNILADLPKSSYSKTYASSILFPFANRISNGKYELNNKSLELTCNDADNNNALHGLIYNKSFNLIHTEIKENYSEITLEYSEEKRESGFPFIYKIIVKYKITNSSLELNLNVINTDKNEFPYTIGWHPYFYSSDLDNSQLIFKADKKVVHNTKMITESLIEFNDNQQLKLENLDDCFALTNNTIEFKTPENHIQLKTNHPKSYLQIYTPKNKNTIAIEPLTGISDSFNNKVGLQILKPNTNFEVAWSIHLKG